MAQVFDLYVPTMAGPVAGANDGLSGSSGGGGQVMKYVSDPTSEALTPSDPTQPAVAYKADGTGALYNWVIASQSWV